MAKRTSAELKIFEALESCTNNDSFCSKASFVQNFLKCELDLNNTQQSFPEDSILEEDEEDLEEEEEEEHGTELDVNEEDDDQQGLQDEESVNLEDSECWEESSILNDSRLDRSGLLGERRAALLAMVLQKHVGQEELRKKVVTFGGTEEEVYERDEEEESEDNDDVEAEEEQSEEGADVESDEQEQVEPDRNHDNEEELVVQTVEKKTPVEEPDNQSETSVDSAVATYLENLLEKMKSLELREKELSKEKEEFKRMKTIEDNKLKAEKRRIDLDRKNLQSLRSDCNKMKFSKEEYEEKIKQLSDQLKDTKLQLNKRINRCTEQQKRLEEKVKALEKENEELKKQQAQKKSLPQRLASLKRPPMRCIPNAAKSAVAPRRVKFAESSLEAVEINKENSLRKGSRLSSSLSESSTLAGSPTRNESTSDMSVTNRSASESPKEVNLSDDEADTTMPSGYTEMMHPCGTITRVSTDNKLTRHIFANKDVMDEFEDCSVRYYYHELKFAQTTYPNGDEIIEYDSGEIEIRRADGSKIYTYTDGLVKMIDGHSKEEEITFPDNSVVKKTPGGETTVTWPSGQREIRTAEFVKRIYTNGTVKIMYNDGSEETRYYNGRIRRKDKTGKLIDDTKKRRHIKNLSSS